MFSTKAFKSNKAQPEVHSYDWDTCSRVERSFRAVNPATAEPSCFFTSRGRCRLLALNTPIAGKGDCASLDHRSLERLKLLWVSHNPLIVKCAPPAASSPSDQSYFPSIVMLRAPPLVGGHEHLANDCQDHAQKSRGPGEGHPREQITRDIGWL